MKYIPVEFPESQELMDKDWFDECVLINDDKLLSVYGSSAYLVPEERYNSLIEPITRIANTNIGLADEEDRDNGSYFEKGTKLELLSVEICNEFESGIKTLVRGKAITGLYGDQEIYETIEITIDPIFLAKKETYDQLFSIEQPLVREVEATARLLNQASELLTECESIIERSNLTLGIDLDSTLQSRINAHFMEVKYLDETF